MELFGKFFIVIIATAVIEGRNKLTLPESLSIFLVLLSHFLYYWASSDSITSKSLIEIRSVQRSLKDFLPIGDYLKSLEEADTLLSHCEKLDCTDVYRVLLDLALAPESSSYLGHIGISKL
jgi:hypothetical protein